MCWSVFQGTLTSLVRECEALHASTNTLLADLLGVDPDSLQPQPHDEDDVCDEGAGLLLPPRMERPARLRGLSAPNTHANQVSVYERSIFERVVTPGQPGLSALGHAPHY